MLRQEALDALTFGRDTLDYLLELGTVDPEIFYQHRVDEALERAIRYYEEGGVSDQEVRFWCVKVPTRALFAWSRGLIRRNRGNIDPRLNTISRLLTEERFAEAEQILRIIEDQTNERAKRNARELQERGIPTS